jgi:hypothetical protein
MDKEYDGELRDKGAALSRSINATTSDATIRRFAPRVVEGPGVATVK